MARKRRIAYVVAAVLAIPAAVLTIEVVKFKLAVGPQRELEAECMADAEVAVGEYLHEHSPPAYGEFKSISGGDVYGPTAWSGVGFFIQGRRTVHYANRSVQIRICIFPRHFTQPDNVVVYLVQGDDYLVSHPRLKSRPTIWGFDVW